MADNTPNTSYETTLRDFFNVVFRRKVLILSIVAMSSAMVFFLNARRPVLWESSSRILVRRGEQSNPLTGSVRYLGWAEEVSSQIEVILSDEVFEHARQIFNDSLKARGMEGTHVFQPGFVRADVVGESNVFVIKYVSFDPAVVKLGCQAMTASFEEYYRERKAPPALADFFADEMADVRKELEHWRARRTQFLNDEKFFGTEEDSRFLLSKIGKLEGQLLALDGDISSQQLRVNNLEMLSRKSGAELENELAFSTSGHVLQSSIVSRIKMSLQNMNIKREELLQKYTDKHPEVVSCDKQIQELHADLEREIENSYNIERQVLESLYAKRAQIQKELDVTEATLDAVPDKQLALSDIDTRISSLTQRYDLLLTKQSESEIALAVHPEWEVTVLSTASNPFSRNTRDYVRLALGPFLALVVALGLAFFLESIDHSIKNGAEVEEYLGHSLLATISEIRK